MELAASDSLGEAMLHIHPPNNDGGHSLRYFPEATGSCKVITNRLDALLQDRQAHFIDLIKLDAQDSDFEALVGLGDYLSPSKIGLIYVEMESVGGLYPQIWDLLLEKGYKPFSAGSAFIDELHYLESLERTGQSIAFFRPTDTIQEGNMLWCGRGGAVEEHLLTIQGRATHKPLSIYPK